MSDAFFGRIFQVIGRIPPFGTVSMTTYFHASARGARGARHCAARRGRRRARVSPELLRPERRALRPRRTAAGDVAPDRLRVRPVAAPTRGMKAPCRAESRDAPPPSVREEHPTTRRLGTMIQIRIDEPGWRNPRRSPAGRLRHDGQSCRLDHAGRRRQGASTTSPASATPNWSAIDGAIQATAGRQGSGATWSPKQTRTRTSRCESSSGPATTPTAASSCAARTAATITDENCYEANIFDQRPDPTYGTGAIVKVAAVSPMPKAGGKWNTYEITASGDAADAGAERREDGRRAGRRSSPAARSRCSGAAARSSSARSQIRRSDSDGRACRRQNKPSISPSGVRPSMPCAARHRRQPGAGVAEGDRRRLRLRRPASRLIAVTRTHACASSRSAQRQGRSRSSLAMCLPCEVERVQRNPDLLRPRR